MIVHHADGLHESVDDGWSAEFEAAADEFLRHRARCGGLGRHLADGAKPVDLVLAVDELPQQLREVGSLLRVAL